MIIVDVAGCDTMFDENGQYCILEQSFPKEQLNKSRVAYMYLEPLTQLCIVSMIKKLKCPQLLCWISQPMSFLNTFGQTSQTKCSYQKALIKQTKCTKITVDCARMVKNMIPC